MLGDSFFSSWPSGIRAQDAANCFNGNRDNSAMSRPANFTESDSAAAACHGRAGIRVLERYCDTRFLIIALCVVANVCRTYLPGARESSQVAGLLVVLERPLRLVRRISSVYRHDRLLVGKQNPVAILLRQLSPRPVDVVAERHQDVAQVLPVPGGRPRGDRALADGQRVVGHHRMLGDLIDAAEAMAIRAGARRRVRRKRLRIEMRLLGG